MKLCKESRFSAEFELLIYRQYVALILGDLDTVTGKTCFLEDTHLRTAKTRCRKTSALTVWLKTETVGECLHWSEEKHIFSLSQLSIMTQRRLERLAWLSSCTSTPEISVINMLRHSFIQKHKNKLWFQGSVISLSVCHESTSKKRPLADATELKCKPNAAVVCNAFGFWSSSNKTTSVCVPTCAGCVVFT